MHACTCMLTDGKNQLGRPIWSYAERFMKIWLYLAAWCLAEQGGGIFFVNKLTLTYLPHLGWPIPFKLPLHFCFVLLSSIACFNLIIIQCIPIIFLKDIILKINIFIKKIYFSLDILLFIISFLVRVGWYWIIISFPFYGIIIMTSNFKTCQVIN